MGLLDDLDKELNNFAMRLREWCSRKTEEGKEKLGEGGFWGVYIGHESE